MKHGNKITIKQITNIKNSLEKYHGYSYNTIQGALDYV